MRYGESERRKKERDKARTYLKIFTKNVCHIVRLETRERERENTEMGKRMKPNGCRFIFHDKYQYQGRIDHQPISAIVTTKPP